MKRILLLVSGIILAGATAFAQSDIEIIGANGNHSLNDSTVTYYGSLPTAALNIGFNVTNVGGVSISVKCKWSLISGIGPVTHTPANAICWGSCYGNYTDTTWTAPSTQIIPVGDTNNTFVGYYYDSANAGTETMRYIFYNSANSKDSSWVIVKYVVAPLGIAQINENTVHISAPYPNPANNNVSFNYRLNGGQQATLEVYNSLGRLVQTLPVSQGSGKLTVNVANLPSGIYICKLNADGSEPAYQRLIIAR